MTEYYIKLTLGEFCQELDLSERACADLIGYGIISPQGEGPEDWKFDVTMISAIRRAIRLRSDLEIDWHDVALISKLIDERDSLIKENELLKQQLRRFLQF